MSDDIFMSYAKGDVYKAELLAKTLEKEGFSVFWDRHILLGPAWEEVIDTSLREARCVILLWSRKSARLGWVTKEAEEAAQRNILVPVLVSTAKLPAAFDEIEAARLVGWDGDTSHEGFQRILGSVREKIAESPPQGEVDDSQKDIAEPGREAPVAMDPAPAPAVTRTADDRAEEPQPSVSEIAREVDARQRPRAAPAPAISRTKSNTRALAATAAVGFVALGTWATMQWMSMRAEQGPLNVPVVNAPVDEPVDDEPVYQEPEVVEDKPRGPEYASDYYEHENGAFQFEGEEWTEYSWDPAAASFTFEETGRDENWIYLYDESRDMDVALPTGEGYMLVREPGDEDWRQHYYLTIPW